MIRGIGPIYAGKLVAAFGAEVFDVIEQAPERLREVPGIGAVRAGRIAQAWADQKVVREIMVFLHSHGVGTARAVRGARFCQALFLRVEAKGISLCVHAHGNEAVFTDSAFRLKNLASCGLYPGFLNAAVLALKVDQGAARSRLHSL
jgi:NAD-dependent DNA ligase